MRKNTIPLSDTGLFNNLIIDYVHEKESLSEFDHKGAHRIHLWDTKLTNLIKPYIETIDEENVMDILIVADTFGLSKLGEECIRYAIVNYSRFNEKKLN